MHKLQNVDALLFDLGGVVLNIDWNRVFLAWSANSRLSSAEIADRFQMDEAYRKHECGLISWQEYFTYLSNLIEYYGDRASFEQGWNSIFVGLIDETICMLSQLGSTLPLYLLTNTNTTHEHRWQADYSSVISLFSNTFVSSTMGFRKPDRRAFEHSLDTMNVDPNKVLFFDGNYSAKII